MVLKIVSIIPMNRTAETRTTLAKNVRLMNSLVMMEVLAYHAHFVAIRTTIAPISQMRKIVIIMITIHNAINISLRVEMESVSI